MAAVESVLSQTYQELELIAIDDGSTDSSWKLLNCFSQKDSRVRVFRHEHRGQSSTRNEAIRLATGEFLANNDADDVSEPTRIQKQVEYMLEHSKCVALGGQVRWVDEDGDQIHSPKAYPDHARIEKVLMTGIASVLQHSSVMFRREALFALPECYSSHLAASTDLDLYLRLVEKGGQLANLPDQILTVVVHGNSTSRIRDPVEANAARKIVLEQARIRRCELENNPAEERVAIPLANSNLQLFQLACRAGNWRAAKKYARKSLAVQTNRSVIVRQLGRIISETLFRRARQISLKARSRVRRLGGKSS